MTDSPPNYLALEPPDGKSKEEYTPDERRAELLRRILDTGSPSAINRAAFGREFGVSRVTAHRDMEAVRDSLDAHLGDDAKLTTRALFERVTDELLDADDWKATKAAWDVAMDWNDWLGDVGAQEREPDRREVDMDVRGGRSPDAYEVVRPEPGEPLPTRDDGSIDYEAMGFTAWPESNSDPGGRGDDPGADPDPDPGADPDPDE